MVVAHRAETPARDPLHDVTLEQIRQYIQDGTAVFIDVRRPETFARGHLNGALNLPAGSTEQMDDYLDQIRDGIEPRQLIILYCSGPHCSSADGVSEYLAGRGFTNTRVYSPGWPALAGAKELQ